MELPVVQGLVCFDPACLASFRFVSTSAFSQHSVTTWIAFFHLGSFRKNRFHHQHRSGSRCSYSCGKTMFFGFGRAHHLGSFCKVLPCSRHRFPPAFGLRLLFSSSGGIYSKFSIASREICCLFRVSRVGRGFHRRGLPRQNGGAEDAENGRIVSRKDAKHLGGFASWREPIISALPEKIKKPLAAIACEADNRG